MHILIPALRTILQNELLAPNPLSPASDKPVKIIENRTDGWLEQHFQQCRWPAIFISSLGGQFKNGEAARSVDEILKVKLLIGFQHRSPNEAALNETNSATALFDQVFDILRKNKRLETDDAECGKVVDALEMPISFTDFDLPDPKKGSFFGIARNVFLQFRRIYRDWQTDFNDVGPVIQPGFK